MTQADQFAISYINYFEYLGNEQQGKCDSDGHVGVCEGEQQHPVRMERGKGEPEESRQLQVRMQIFYI